MASPHELDLTGAPTCPLSALYHEESKLGPHRMASFREHISRFSQDEQAIFASLSESLKSYPTRPAIALPRCAPCLDQVGLRETLFARQSYRGEMTGQPIALATLGSWLDMAASVTADIVQPKSPNAPRIRMRSWASGGGLYPIETYVVVVSGSPELDAGVYHYQPLQHELRRLNNALIHTWTDRVFWDLDKTKAAVLLVLTATFARTQAKYGERGYRIALLDAGHLGQNLLLSATALQLAVTPLGGFDEDAIARDLELDPYYESPIHIILAGCPSPEMVGHPS